MNNNNIVKIGTALKWRNTFDIEKKYYQENIVTACGCVFRCKVLQAQGKVPIRTSDDNGHIVYANTDVWDVLVDMAYYYNYTVDTQKLTGETLDYVKKLNEAFQKQQKEIKTLQEDNAYQWERIRNIENINTEQQREIDTILDTISCFSEGIWIDTLLWSNDTVWDNNKYAITDDLQNQINVLADTHHQDIEDLSERHNQEISALAAHVAKQEKMQDGINNYLQDQVYDLNSSFSCFGSGVWEDGLHWSNEMLWDNNKFAITDNLKNQIDGLTESHKDDIDALTDHLEKSDNAFNNAVAQNKREHDSFVEHLQDNDKQIESLKTLTSEHDRQLLDLLDNLSCFGNGQWNNELKWSDRSLWQGSNQMCDAFTDVYSKIENSRQSITGLEDEINSVKQNVSDALGTINQTFNDFSTEHESFRTEHDTFKSEHQAFGKRIDVLAEHLERIGSINEEQQHQIDSLLHKVSLATNGLWDNMLLWVNDSEWSNTKGAGEGDACNCPSNTQERIEGLEDSLAETNQKVNANFDLISKCQVGISDNSERITENLAKIEVIKQDAVTEHRNVAYQLRAVGREQTIQDENIAKLGEHFSCFADGVWGDLFIWDNELRWANQTGVTTEIQDRVAAHDERIGALEKAFADLVAQLNTQKDTIERQQQQLEALTDLFTLTNVGIWQNPLRWDNGTRWSDSLITEQLSGEETTGASVSVKSYDEKTATVSI